MGGCGLVSDLADSRFVVHLCDPQRFDNDGLAFEHSLPDVGKAAGSARQSRKIKLVGQQVGFGEVSYLPTQLPKDIEGELTRFGLQSCSSEHLHKPGESR